MRHQSQKRRRALVCGASFFVTALAAAPALADDVGGGVLFYGLGSFANLRGLPLGVGGEGVEPDPLKGRHLRLEGGGHLGGAGLQLHIFGKHVRGGFGMNVFGVEGTTLKYDTLAHGFSARPTTGWGAGLDVFVGHEFLRGPVRPYIDLVGGFSAVSTQIDLMHPQFGRLGRTQYQGWSFGFGPRAGISVPLSKNVFFDLSGTYSVVGLDKLRIVSGIGFRAP